MTATRRRSQPLRAVAPGESSGDVLTVTTAADNGTTRDLLVAMRTRVAKAVEDPETPARDLASLTKRLIDIARDIEAIDARDKQEAERGGPSRDEAWTAV